MFVFTVLIASVTQDPPRYNLNPHQPPLVIAAVNCTITSTLLLVADGVIVAVSQVVT